MTIMHPSFAAADDDRVTTCRAQTGAGQPPPGVAMSLTEAGRVVDGHGSDPDPIVSATRAYIHALNQLQAQDQGPMAFVGDFWRL